MIKMTVSYDTEEELNYIIKTLENKTISYKVPKKQSGKFKKAYFILKNAPCKTKKETL